MAEPAEEISGGKRKQYEHEDGTWITDKGPAAARRETVSSGLRIGAIITIRHDALARLMDEKVGRQRG